MEKLRNVFRLGVLIGLLTLLPGCASEMTSRHPATPEDLSITRQVSDAIFQEPTLRTSQISVKTTNGVVRLTGVVEKALNVETATEIAKSVPGVVEVKNELAVKE